MNQQRVATDISINYDPSGKGGGQQEHAAAKGSSATETTWSPALTDFNEVLVGLGQKPLDTASLKLPTLAAYYPETVTPSSTASTAESASTTPRILFWYHPDYLGNVDLVTEIDGYAHEFFMYNPWGEEMHQWNANTYAFTSPYRFNAKELDPETGLAYYGARYYQNKLGVWLSVDPLAGQGPNWPPDRFAVDNPLKYSDFNGLFETQSDAKEWAKDNNIRLGLFSNYKLKQSSDGLWEINNYRKGLSYFRDQSYHKDPVLTMEDSFIIETPIVSDDSRSFIIFKSTKDLIDAFSFGNSAKLDILNIATIRNELMSRFEFDNLSKLKAYELRTKALGSAGSKYFSVANKMGGAANGFSFIAAGYIFVNEPSAGNGARLIIHTTATASTLIPGAGWAISMGISAADVLWGEDFYEFIDKK
jgi:RHS repeat-associated protein